MWDQAPDKSEEDALTQNMISEAYTKGAKKVAEQTASMIIMGASLNDLLASLRKLIDQLEGGGQDGDVHHEGE